MTPARPVIAFHAPLKPPDAPTPSGDRRIARLTLQALTEAGFAPRLASARRTLDLVGDPARQAAAIDEAQDEADALAKAWRAAPPALWFTYHCYWKAPDLLGPRVAEALGIPYVISEPSLSPRRRAGPWAAYAAQAEAAIRAADLLLWSTPRDLPMLRAAGGLPLAQLPPFLDLGPPPPPGPPPGPLRLVAAAMMRPGDKLASYRALAEALSRLPQALDWRLDVAGDGAERAAVETLLAPHRARAAFHGELDPPALRALFEASDLLAWPGVGEGIGMVYLEAQSAGLPCLAEDRPGPRHVIDPSRALPPPNDPAAFAAALEAFAASDRPAARRAARAHAVAHHGLPAAARRLTTLLTPLIGAPVARP
ncbi:MAG: glycosyltransferase [Pseudomonadota bacterium]